MVFNSVSDAVFVFDAVTKTLIEANSQALRDTGYQTEEIKDAHRSSFSGAAIGRSCTFPEHRSSPHT
ncbi:MAG: hypothetical protein ACREV4_10515 [Gammaproteobacteria bacterium]